MKPGIRTVTLLLATALALTGTGSASGAPADSGALDGLWRTDGYGTLVAIDHGGHRLRTYETTALGCLPGATDATGTGSGRFRQPGEPDLTVRPDGPGRARLAFDDDAGHRTLLRTRSAPKDCAGRPDHDPRHIFDVFWQTFAENYPFFAARKTDWTAVRDRFRPQVTAKTTEDQLFAILRQMIEPLRDGHTYLDAGPGRRFSGHRADTELPTPASIARIDRAVAESVGVPLRRWARGALSYADLPDGTGYLRITRFTGYADKGGFPADMAELDRALDEILTPARTSGPRALRGLILDLRFNGGGSDRLALRVAQRLTDRPYTAYAKRARNDPRDPRRFTIPEPIHVTPRPGPRFTGPLAVLTGRLTISAGETFTQALMSRAPAPVRIGENTQGLFSDILDRHLPNGWTFGLPNEEYLTPATHRTYDITGIPPHIAVPVFTDEEFAHHHDSALAQARKLLRSTP
ncbi:S41 family peptidase [Streptomyces orinoci]|uniref:S41 family peptidase n=1 Tax=Streptomyces orinoci TaxID=67339 RepID=A0ABV3K4L9_STRON|nr:S41 family peptidase [Streptomyces orinoci]